MSARDRQGAALIRIVLAALENAEAVPVAPSGTSAAPSEHVAGAAGGLGAGEAPRRTLGPHDERALVEREIAELRSSAATLAEMGQHERAAELLRAAEIVEEAAAG